MCHILKGCMLVDRKMMCGVLLVIVGLVFSAVDIVCGALCGGSYSYNGNQFFGILGALLATHLVVPLIISLVILILGLGLCFLLAFRGKQ